MSKWFTKYSTSEEVLAGKETGITAHPGGGQASATVLSTKKFHRVDACASDFDSVKFISAPIGGKQVVFNNTAKTASVYPATGEKINGVVDKQCNVPAGLAGIFESFEDGNWSFWITQLDQVVLEAEISLTKNQIKSLFASPVDVIPAPGVGLAIELIAGYSEYTYDGTKTGGSPFYTSPVLSLYAETAYGPSTNDFQMNGPTLTAPNAGSSGQFSTPYTERNLFVRSGASSSYPFNGFQGGQRIIENKKIKVTCQAGATTSAAWGTAKIKVAYRIVKLA